MPPPERLPVVEFDSPADLRLWLSANHATSAGVLVRLRKGSGPASLTFHDLLEQGLCFGWSESTRYRSDHETYLQKFTPRRRRGTSSPRNAALARRLTAEGQMTETGLRALRG